MEVLKAQKQNNNFYTFENMLYSKTGIEICYLGEDRDKNEGYSFYENGCRHTLKNDDEVIISYFSNDGKRMAYLKETRKEYFDKTILLPLKNGVFVSFVDKDNVVNYGFKSIYGKEIIDTSFFRVNVFINEYNRACDQVF